MRILALDPSSSCVGWAVGDVTRDRDGRPQFAVLDAGRLVGKKAHAYTDRCDQFARDLTALVAAALTRGPDLTLTALVEIPGGKVHTGRHGGGGAGLSVYGFACGALWATLAAPPHGNRVTRVGIRAEEWTGGHSKAKRALVAKRLWPPYAPERDPGGDIADAVALAAWWTAFRAPDARGNNDANA